MPRYTQGNGSLPWSVSACNVSSTVPTDTTYQVVEYLTLQLIQGYGVDNLTTSFLDKYDFYIFPFVNPDGTSPHFRCGIDTTLTLNRLRIHPNNGPPLAQEPTAGPK